MFIANLFRHWTYQLFAPGTLLREKYDAFRTLLESDKKSHELIAELEEIYHEQLKVDLALVEKKYKALSSCVSTVVNSVTRICPTCYLDLRDYFNKIDHHIQLALTPGSFEAKPPFILPLTDVNREKQGLVGGKALNVALAGTRLGLPVPSGFVITAGAHHYFIEFNNLRSRIDATLAAIDIDSAGSLEEGSRELMDLVLGASVPEEIQETIRASLRKVVKEKHGRVKVSVRSSAVGEDTEASFAGQYRSVLNVTEDSIVDAYRQVIASKYSPSALFYRINHGLSDVETPMAVLVLEMIDARASGVIYTRDPREPTLDSLVLHTVWGLGELLVDGSVSGSVITVARDEPHRVKLVEQRDQRVKAIFESGGGTRVVPVTVEQQDRLPLDSGSISDLTEWGIKLEDFYGGPQDIEWCLDQEENLYLLQSRPLKLEEVQEEVLDCRELKAESGVLLSGGTKASSGIGAGAVFNVEHEADLKNLSEGAVLVARRPSPEYVKVMGKLSAVVTDVGSTAGHFASVAREFGVPTLVNTGVGTKNLRHGDEVTVHADGRVVYEGLVSELLESPCARRSLLADSPFMKRIRRALDCISPLNLVDPKAKSFVPAGCKSLHDILRFAHEKGVQEMFFRGGRGGRRAKGAKKLVANLPLAVYFLDLGGGLSEEAITKKEVEPADIVSKPMRALWRGLSNPGLHWSRDVQHFDWRGFDRTSEGIGGADSKSLASYAILARDYLNLNIHFGYHFVVLDTLCGDVPDNNHIMLRFAGGGAALYSRFLRVKFLEAILACHGFEVQIKGDLIDAQMTRRGSRTLEGKLETVGLLLGCTRVLDMALRDGSQVEEMVEKFNDGIYDLSPLSRR